MSAKDDKHTDAHTASAATIKPALHYVNVSIAQAIDEAIHDNSKPSDRQCRRQRWPRFL